MRTERMLTRTWKDDRINWVVASKLSDRQRSRVNDIVKYGPPSSN